MRLTPVKHYRQPDFPTRAILDTQPELLWLAPKRWQRNALVLTALATTCALVSARWASAAGKQPATSRVAPIFLHGSGGEPVQFMGKRVPPVLLTEEDARLLITEEAKKAGITFIADAQTLTDLPLPGAKQKLKLTMDGVAQKRKIAYEYVSMSDYRKWKGNKQPLQSIAAAHDILSTATILHDGLTRAHPAGTYAVFYDPCIEYSDVVKSAKDQRIDWQVVQQEEQVLARKELRRQVRDFITWLKAQGVI